MSIRIENFREAPSRPAVIAAWYFYHYRTEHGVGYPAVTFWKRYTN
mgnify:FL=1